jgi:hypothetical protein
VDEHRAEGSQYEERELRHSWCRSRHSATPAGGGRTILPIREPRPSTSHVSRRTAAPQLKGVAARAAASLATAVVVPAALFAVTLMIVDIDAAVIVALAWMASAMCWRWATKRPVSGLLVLTLVIMAIRTAFTLATGNTFVYFVQPVFADATVATIFLGSLLTARPIVARIAPDFYPVDDVLAARPRIRRLFRRLTLLWGLVIVAKASLTLWLLLSLSTVNFVLIKGSAIISLTLLAAGATLALSAVVGRQEGLLRTA